MIDIDETAVRQIVQMTIKELQKQDLMRDAVHVAYREISERLQRFYAPLRSPEDDKELSAALEQLKGDRYRHILWMFYRDGYTIEEIAEQINVDVSTVTRNKKRLCLELYAKLHDL